LFYVCKSRPSPVILSLSSYFDYCFQDSFMS
jgi:hypothetical protein